MKDGISLCAAAIALVVTCRAQAFAQGLTCVAIRPGDTAVRLAERLTGDAARWHEPWFHIVDTAASRSIAKREYARILPGWRACVQRPGRITAGEAPFVAVQQAWSSRAWVQRLAIVDARVWWAVILVSALVFVWGTAGYERDRRTMVNIMAVFGEQFIREFERPLRRPGSDGRALNTKLHFKPGLRRLDILLAPNDGRTYPNLTDHRNNLEYDVGRVMRLLNDERFVEERLLGRGRWVIVRCRFTTDAAPGEGLT